MRNAAALALLMVVLLPSAGHAYLDPGTGSAVLQMIVASVMGALFILKVYWRKLVAFFGGGPAEQDDASSREDADRDERQ